MKKTTTTAATFTADTFTMNGKSFPAKYSVSFKGDVFIFTTVTSGDDTMPIRIHIGADHPMYSAALAAAKPAKSAPVAEVKPEAVAEVKAVKPAKKATKKAEVKPEAVTPAAGKALPVAIKAEVKPEVKPAAPVASDKGIAGNGWRIAFDEATARTRVIFDGKPTEAQHNAVCEAGFYWSNVMKSYNKKLNAKGKKAAADLAITLAAIK